MPRTEAKDLESSKGNPSAGKTSSQRVSEIHLTPPKAIEPKDFLPKKIGPIENHQTALPRIAKDQGLVSAIENVLQEIPTSHRFIHHNSDRADQPFLIINLPAIPENLLESSLFGHDKGAFTGAVQTLAGKFELADSGTIFLDEIGEMSLEHQSKLLRVIETGEFERVGSSRRRYCNVRIITATSRDLEELVAAGKFRQDLLFRIKVMPIHVAPLRDRTADIRPLTAHFLNILNRRNSKKILGVTDEVIFVFEKQQWKGNIRELAHLLERMVIYCDPQKNILDESDIPFEYMLSDSKNGEPDGLVAKKEAFERQLLMRALVRNGFNKSATARELGMPVETLRYRVEKFGINVTRLGEG